LYVGENGKVDYSHLSGDFTVYISDDGGNVLSTFELSVTQEEITDEPPTDGDIETLENSVLPTVLAVILILLAAGGITTFFLKKRKNKKSN
jgi:hypothetical protein